VSKSAISVTENGRSPRASGCAEPSDWQAAHNAATAAACNIFQLNRSLPN
jgi:hypothetical protein